MIQQSKKMLEGKSKRNITRRIRYPFIYTEKAALYFQKDIAYSVSREPARLGEKVSD